MGVSYKTWLDVIASKERAVAEAANSALSFRDEAYIINFVFSAKLFYVFRIPLLQQTVVSRFTALCGSFLKEGGTELVARASLRLPRSQGGWSLACVTHTLQLLVMQAVLRVLVDIDHPARSLALFFLEPRRCVRVPRALCNSYPSVEHMPFLYACVCVVFHQLTTSFTKRDVLSLTPACLAKALWAADVSPCAVGCYIPLVVSCPCSLC